mgnify:CR=1 FL=1
MLNKGLSLKKMNCFILFTVFLFLAVACPQSVSADEKDHLPTHVDKKKLPKGCAECHKGHGEKATPMLQTAKDKLCVKCHGPGGKQKDVYATLTKPSNHPIIQTSKHHALGEELPERNPSTPRHVACSDCHNVHESSKGNAVKGLRGYSVRSQKTVEQQGEHEVCYKCHTDSQNLQRGKNVSVKFASTNPSYHPVETIGRNRSVPSLIKNVYNSMSTIKCSSCHGNDDPMGPAGPHGSLYAPLLKARYVRTVGPESTSSYALCYLCHNRMSILNDESFKAHKAHVVYGQVSCAQCHDSHGSILNPYLINFDTSVVTPNSKGQLIFMQGVPGKPLCFLKCHVNGTYEHMAGDPFKQSPPPCDKARYVVKSNTRTLCPQDWQF